MQVNLLGNVVDDRTGTVNVGFEIDDILNSVRIRGDINVSKEEYNKAFMNAGLGPMIIEKLSKSLNDENGINKGVVLLKDELDKELKKMAVEFTMMIMDIMKQQTPAMPPMPPNPEGVEYEDNTNNSVDNSSVDTNTNK